MTYVYAAKSSDFVKIGISTHPLKRVATLTGDPKCPGKSIKTPKIIHAAVGSREDERLLHQKLHEHRIDGEWYRADCLVIPGLVEFFANRPIDFGPAAPTWMRIRTTAVILSHIKAEAAKRGVTSRKLVMDAVVKLVGPPSQELIDEVRRGKRVKR